MRAHHERMLPPTRSRRASRVLEQFMVCPPRLAVYLDDMRKVFLRLAVCVVHLRALAHGVAARRRACAGVTGR